MNRVGVGPDVYYVTYVIRVGTGPESVYLFWTERWSRVVVDPLSELFYLCKDCMYKRTPLLLKDQSSPQDRPTIIFTLNTSPLSTKVVVPDLIF